MRFLESFVVLASLMLQPCSGGLLLRNLPLEVGNGRTLYITKRHLEFTTHPEDICKVQVVQNEPMHQKVGELTPKIFDCDYLPDTLLYQHNGSPLLSEDTVKLQVHRLLANKTIQETVYLHIKILNSKCDVIRTGKQILLVPRFNELSNQIDKNVLQFHFDRLFNNKCEVRIQSVGNKVPDSGQLVALKSDRVVEAVGAIFSECDDFLLLGLRYQHLSPPTPDVDYVPLHVIISDRRSGRILKQERHWLPVKIDGAYSNQIPRASYDSLKILEVDQFVPTNILSTTVSAVDSETDNGKLIFNVTSPPAEGFITHLDDETRPVESFYQNDVANLKIAYQPPNVSYTVRQTFTVEFVIVDGYFSASNPIKVMLSIRVSHTDAPRIAWNTGLTMLEGQSRPITKDCLQIMDQDSLNLVRITLAGGLQHGRLQVNGRPGYSFSWKDVEKRSVVYTHDDTDTTSDHMMFRVSDITHSTRFKMPIAILPKDDAPPVLITNVNFVVQEGQTIGIYRYMLEAFDQDSSSDYITFEITREPTAGQVLKRREWERAGWKINKFQQRDLYQGLIYYKHLGEEIFEDSFDVILKDSSRPNPNISPVQTVSITITPVDDLPPKAAPNITRSLVVRETDLVFLTPEMLLYVDDEEPGSDLTYTLATECQFMSPLDTQGKCADAGHLVYTEDMVMLMKDPSVPVLKTFTQNAINHEKVAFMPPMEDVGVTPVDATFEFSVSDSHGTTLSGQQFFVTILPVDNQAPSLEIVGELHAQEGGTVLLTSELLKVADRDTPITQLKFILVAEPTTGSLKRNINILSTGDSFSYADIEEFRIIYQHDGEERHRDNLQLIVTDGHQNSSSSIIVVEIQPVDDEKPSFGNSISLEVQEGGTSLITSEHLHATDIDTDDEKLIFETVQGPYLGHVLVNDEVSDFFTQEDILSNHVQYKHNGDEVGYTEKKDTITFIVSDKPRQYGGPHPSDDAGTDYRDGYMETYDLNITVTPVNNRPPNILVGSAVFMCDEAGKHPLNTSHLMANDLDSRDEDLAFLITSPPNFGYIEDNTPRPGYEKQIGVRVDTFKLSQLEDGYIYYVQSKHQKIEPTADVFHVSVTDGKYSSAEIPFLIAILPTNDEAPDVQVNNFSCAEGDMCSISESVLTVSDLDMPADEVMITVTVPPGHGMVMDEMKIRRAKRSGKKEQRRHEHAGHAMEHFSLDEWANHLVQPVYLHDGSENSEDEFVLKISDGKHVQERTLDINIILVNDEKPVTIVNKGITIERGDFQIISNIVLHSADGDSPDDELVYIIHSLPTHGTLQIKENNQWIKLQYGDTFTEDDVTNNFVQYSHSTELGSKLRDSFRFSVTDGKFTTGRETFHISIKPNHKSILNIITHPTTVREGDKVFITTDILTASDGLNGPEDITFKVVTAPLFSQIEYINLPDVAINLFTQLDLVSRKVLYSHTSKVDSGFDSFTVQVENGVHAKESVVTLHIEAVDALLPTLVLFPTYNKASAHHLTVFSGSSVAITHMIISITDPDSAVGKLKIIITKYPEHGTLTLGETTLQGPGLSEVGLTSLQNAELMYKHAGDHSEIDRFSFLVTDGVHSGYIVDGKIVQEPTDFNIKIERLDDSAPKIIRNVPSNSIETFGRKMTMYAVYIDSHSLVTVDDGSDDANQIVFTVTEPPSHGILRKARAKDDYEDATDFTQKDLNERKLLYILDGKLNVTNDSFEFDVQDAWGNTAMGNRFVMRWSRIEVHEKALVTCESMSQNSIMISRHGGLSVSSFVGVRIMSKSSATVNKDFSPSTASQVQFDPGVGSGQWRFQIFNDSILEGREKFKIELHSPVNAVLAPDNKRVEITILDASSKRCYVPGTASNLKKTEPFRRVKNNRGLKRSKKAKQRRKSKKRENTKRVRDKHKKNILRDDPKHKRFDMVKRKKYGKLGAGITVSPAEYYRNETHRIWKYHGLIPITIDETEKVVKRKNPSKAERIVNDAPHQEIQDVMGDEFRSPSKYVHHNDVPIPPDSFPLHSSPRRCTISMKNRLYYDPVSRVLNQCNGAEWTAWIPSKNRITRPVTNSGCETNWHQYKTRCFYIHPGSSSGESWNSAQRRCREEFSAQLATVSSKKHMNWLWKKGRKQKAWIGFNNKLNPHEWEWASGDPVLYTNWKGSHGRIAATNLVSKCAAVTARKRWVSRECTSQIINVGFICMKDSV